MLACMKTRSAFLALAAAVVLLSGCSASEPSTAPTPTPSEQQVEETSTVAQWASLIAQQKATWEEWEADWDAASCSGIVAGSESGAMCRIRMMSAMYQAQTTAIEYELATGPGKKGFIAEQPPAEIASLFAETVDASAAARDAGMAWDAAGCTTSAAGDCPTLSVTFDRAIGDLMSEFDAWAPYL